MTIEKIGGLGRGLGALIPETPKSGWAVEQVPVGEIQSGHFQPRERIDDVKLHELAESIREKGVISPIIVRKSASGGGPGPTYELVAGERRLRAVLALGVKEIPAIVRDLDDAEAAKLALIENVQREDLTAIEEAKAYQRLQREFGLTQEQVGKEVGKDRVTVANMLRLLQLPRVVQEAVGRGVVGMAHARALLALPTERLQLKLLGMIQDRGLSARRVEELVRQWTSGKARRVGPRDPHLATAEEQLRQRFGTKVTIQHGRRRGWIRFEYYSLEDLNRLLAIWKVKT